MVRRAARIVQVCFKFTEFGRGTVHYTGQLLSLRAYGRLTWSHLLHSQTLVLAIQLVHHLGISRILHYSAGNAHVGQCFQQINLGLDLMIFSQNWRRIATKYVRNSGKVTIAEVQSSLLERSVVSGARKGGIGHEFGQIFQNLKPSRQGPLAQLAQRQLLRVVRHGRHRRQEVLLVKDKGQKFLHRLRQGTLDLFPLIDIHFVLTVVFVVRLFIVTLDKGVLVRLGRTQPVLPFQTRLVFELLLKLELGSLQSAITQQCRRSKLPDTAPACPGLVGCPGGINQQLNPVELIVVMRGIRLIKSCIPDQTGVFNKDRPYSD